MARAAVALADLPLTAFLSEAVVPYESDEVTRLIVDTHDAATFAPLRHLTVGGLRDALLAGVVDPADVRSITSCPTARSGPMTALWM